MCGYTSTPCANTQLELIRRRRVRLGKKIRRVFAGTLVHDEQAVMLRYHVQRVCRPCVTARGYWPSPPAASRTSRGRAVQVDPIKPIWKAPKTKRLKLKYDEPPSKFAFKFNVRRYNVGAPAARIPLATPQGDKTILEQGHEEFLVEPQGRGFHSSTFRLSLSDFCGTGGAFRGCVGDV